jgi:DNA-binding transcriptional ArsR family regulator
MTGSTGQQVLRYMWSKDNPGITVKTVSEEFDVSVSTASAVLRKLEAQGLTRRDHGRFESRPGFDSEFSSRSKLALVLAGGKDGKRTPDIWFATDAGMQLVDEYDAHRSMQLANDYNADQQQDGGEPSE